MSMKTIESGIISIYGDSPRMRVLEYFMQFPKNEFTYGDIVEAVGMSRTTAFKEVSKLLDNDMIVPFSKIGKSITYKINLKNPLVRVIQKSVSYRSGEIANKQTARKHIQILIRASLKNKESLLFRQKLLNNELRLTRNMIKKIRA